MIRGDFHVHTRFCDGQASPEAIVRAALERGLPAVCGHYGQAEPLVGLQWPLCGHQARVHVHVEGLWQVG